MTYTTYGGTAPQTEAQKRHNEHMRALLKLNRVRAEIRLFEEDGLWWAMQGDKIVAGDSPETALKRLLDS